MMYIRINDNRARRWLMIRFIAAYRVRICTCPSVILPSDDGRPLYVYTLSADRLRATMARASGQNLAEYLVGGT